MQLKVHIFSYIKIHIYVYKYIPANKIESGALELSNESISLKPPVNIHIFLSWQSFVLFSRLNTSASITITVAII
jgi:hypothetical protein